MFTGILIWRISRIGIRMAGDVIAKQIIIIKNYKQNYNEEQFNS
jgi:hypothetical protein